MYWIELVYCMRAYTHHFSMKIQLADYFIHRAHWNPFHWLNKTTTTTKLSRTLNSSACVLWWCDADAHMGHTPFDSIPFHWCDRTRKSMFTYICFCFCFLSSCVKYSVQPTHVNQTNPLNAPFSNEKKKREGKKRMRRNKTKQN